MDPSEEEIERDLDREARIQDRLLQTGVWNLFTLDDRDHLLVNLAPVVTTAVSVLVVAWGLLALVSPVYTRTGYYVAAVLVGAALYRTTGAFTNGERWALPVVALVPLAVAVALYVRFGPTYPLRGPGDAVVWLLIAVTGLSPLTLAVGSVHPSWVDER